MIMIVLNQAVEINGVIKEAGQVVRVTDSFPQEYIRKKIIRYTTPPRDLPRMGRPKKKGKNRGNGQGNNEHNVSNGKNKNK